MTDLAKLRTEIVGDPLARGYAGMTDGQLAADLHTVDRTIERETLPSWEVMDAIVPAERAGLANTVVVSAADRALFDNWIGAGEINIQRVNTRSFFASIFTTADFPLSRANLLALQTRPASRAEELGIGFVRQGDVQYARTL